MQRRSDGLLERNLTGQKLVRRLQVVHARSVLALQNGRERREIDLTTLISSQRDPEILASEWNQRIAIEDGGFVSVPRAAEQGRNRGCRLDFYQRLVGPRCCEAGLRAHDVLVLLHPEKNRQIETDDADPITRLRRSASRKWRKAGNQVVVVLNARSEVRQVLHLREVQRRIGVTLGQGGFEDFLAGGVSEIGKRVELDGERFEFQGSIDGQRRAERAIELQIQSGLVVRDGSLVLMLKLASRGEAELGTDNVSLRHRRSRVSRLGDADHLVEVQDVLGVDVAQRLVEEQLKICGLGRGSHVTNGRREHEMRDVGGTLRLVALMQRLAGKLKRLGEIEFAQRRSTDWILHAVAVGVSENRIVRRDRLRDRMNRRVPSITRRLD